MTSASFAIAVWVRHSHTLMRGVNYVYFDLKAVLLDLELDEERSCFSLEEEGESGRERKLQKKRREGNDDRLPPFFKSNLRTYPSLVSLHNNNNKKINKTGWSCK